MDSSNPSILFVSHDASRTGAPIVLLTFLKWLRANTDYEFEILLGRGGELEPSFAEVARTTTTGLPLGESLRRVSSRLGLRQPSRPDTPGELPAPGASHAVDQIGPTSRRGQWRKGFTASLPPGVGNVWHNERMRLLARRFAGVPLVYSNTLQNGALLRDLLGPGQKVVSHVHELEWWLEHRTSPADLSFTKEVTDHFIACSNVALENLVHNQSVPRERTTLCHSFIAVDEVMRAASVADRGSTRRRLGIPEDALLVGGMGTTDWRKGPDLFVQLAASVTKALPQKPVHFLWAGGEREGAVRGSLLIDAKRLDVADRVKFIGHVAEPAHLLAAMDVFALTSREDPYPLVMLEAAAVGLPVVCFAHSGGAPEFVEEDTRDAGHVSPYLDVADMSLAVTRLLEHDNERTSKGRIAAERVRSRHDVDKAAPALVEVIRRQLKS